MSQPLLLLQADLIDETGYRFHDCLDGLSVHFQMYPLSPFLLTGGKFRNFRLRAESVHGAAYMGSEFLL